MFDFYINPATGDVAYENGTVTLITEPKKRVRQELEITLRTFIGEWFNNLEFGGINRRFIGNIGVSKIEVDAFYRSVILSNPEVIEIVDFYSTLNPISRQYDLEFTVRTYEGEVSVVSSSASNEVEYEQPDEDIYLPPTVPSLKSMATFIRGTSSISAIFQADGIPFVVAPITGVSSMAATPLKLWNATTLTGSSAMAASNLIKVLAATLEGDASLTASVGTIMVANITGNTSSLSASPVKAASLASSNTSNISATFRKQLAASLTGSGAISATMLQGGQSVLTGDSAITAAMVKRFGANLTGSSDILANYTMVFSSTITNTSSMSAAFNKRLQANVVNNTSSLQATNRKRLTMSSGNVSNMSAVLRKRMQTNIPATVNTVIASPRKGAFANIGGNQGYITANLSKIKYTSANIAGNVSSLNSNLTKMKLLSSSIGNAASMAATASLLTDYDTLILSTAEDYWKLHDSYTSGGPGGVVYNLKRPTNNDVIYPSGITYNATGVLPEAGSKSIINTATLAANGAAIAAGGLLTNASIYTGDTAQTICLWFRSPSSFYDAVLYEESIVYDGFVLSTPIIRIGINATGRIYVRIYSEGSDTDYASWTMSGPSSGSNISPNTNNFLVVRIDTTSPTDSIVSMYKNAALSTLSHTTVGTFALPSPPGAAIALAGTAQDTLPFRQNIERFSRHNSFLSATAISNLYTAGTT